MHSVFTRVFYPSYSGPRPRRASALHALLLLRAWARLARLTDGVISGAFSFALLSVSHTVGDARDASSLSVILPPPGFHALRFRVSSPPSQPQPALINLCAAPSPAPPQSLAVLAPPPSSFPPLLSFPLLQSSRIPRCWSRFLLSLRRRHRSGTALGSCSLADGRWSLGRPTCCAPRRTHSRARSHRSGPRVMTAFCCGLFCSKPQRDPRCGDFRRCLFPCWFDARGNQKRAQLVGLRSGRDGRIARVASARAPRATCTLSHLRPILRLLLAAMLLLRFRSVLGSSLSI